MSELVADVQSVVGRLGALENELRQLRNLVSSQWRPTTPATSVDHPYVTRVENILSGEPIIEGTRTPVRQKKSPASCRTCVWRRSSTR